jgi:hypothetical protein
LDHWLCFDAGAIGLTSGLGLSKLEVAMLQRTGRDWGRAITTVPPSMHPAPLQASFAKQ